MRASTGGGLTMRVEEVLARLKGVHRSGEGWAARCPAHDDPKPSLSIGTGERGQILLRCHAGCEVKSIVERVGLRMTDLFNDDEGPAMRATLTNVPATYLPPIAYWLASTTGMPEPADTRIVGA